MTPGVDIAQEILAYLVKRPQAQDTVEGIARWWILQQRIEQHVEDVEDALNRLVLDGFVIEFKPRALDAMYTLNKEKLAEIQALLVKKSK